MRRTMTAWLALLATVLWIAPGEAQVRGGRRRAVVKGEEGKGAAVGPRGAAVKGEDGYAAVGRHGAAVRGDEGYAAVGRHGGAAVHGEDGYAAVGRRGAVVAGEEGYAAVGRRGVVVGNQYESVEAWKVVAGVGAVMAIGTLLARPPKAATVVTVSGSSYWYDGGTYYTRVMSNGAMVYQVCAPPPGAVIVTLPAGCSSVHAGNVTYSQCGTTYYQRVSSGYQVVVLQ